MKGNLWSVRGAYEGEELKRIRLIGPCNGGEEDCVCEVRFGAAQKGKEHCAEKDREKGLSA